LSTSTASAEGPEPAQAVFIAKGILCPS